MTGFILFYIIACIVCYLIGSIPSAFLVLKKFHGKNIMDEGSGNVGAMNSFDVTGSKMTGFVVFAFDFLKGFIPVAVLIFVFDLYLPYIMIPAVMLVIGHNYSIFLKFKGGRGLATAAGASMLINYSLMVIWCFLFVATFLIKRNVHWGNVIATILMPLMVYILSGFILQFTLGYIDVGSGGYYTALEEQLFVFSSSISLIILLKHINPIVELLKKKKENE